MNLNAIVSSPIAAVNPRLPVQVQLSTGPGPTGPDGRRQPTFGPPINVLGQVQPTTWKDLQQLEGLNISGVRWKIYLSGEVDGIVRAESRGGDRITIPSPSPHAGLWLVAQVLESWPNWVCAAITLQQTGS